MLAISVTEYVSRGVFKGREKCLAWVCGVVAEQQVLF